MCLHKPLTVILHCSLHPGLVAATLREVPYTSRVSLSSIPLCILLLEMPAHSHSRMESHGLRAIPL